MDEDATDADDGHVNDGTKQPECVSTNESGTLCDRRVVEETVEQQADAGNVTRERGTVMQRHDVVCCSHHAVHHQVTTSVYTTCTNHAVMQYWANLRFCAPIKQSIQTGILRATPGLRVRSYTQTFRNTG